MRAFRFSLLSLALLTTQSQALDAFTVKDIRVEGIQRTEAGTVFSYLPVKVGETLTPEKAAEAIKALYATGFFKDVRLEAVNEVLVVVVEERSAIASIDFTGMKEFPKDDMKSGMKQLGLAEGRILDKSLLDKAEQELKRQYFNRGMYAVQVKVNTSPLERNRVAVSFDVVEGEVAKIRSINIVGAKAYAEKDLLKEFILRTPGWMTWWTHNDQYSKQKLSSDLEALRSYYQNKGYLEFRIESTQVSITPDKKDVYITVNIEEGNKYTVSDFRFAGEMPVPEEELRKLVTLKVGDEFSRERLNESTKNVGERLGNDGYAFANVNAAPEIDKEKRTVSFTLLVDPGRKVYVHRVNVTGNTRTKDEVVRREMRQVEGSWFAADKVTRSKERIDRLGYFKEVNIETPPVAGTTDQVDLNVNVVEQPTGSILIGAGFSSSEGLVLSGGVSQNNLFGSGNRLSLQLNSGKVNKVYSLSFTNPYFTQDGLSLGYDLYRKDVDTASLDSLAYYGTSTMGFGARLGVPLNELDTVQIGAALEQSKLDLNANSPTIYRNFVTTYGGTCAVGTACSVTTNTLRLDLGWARDSRDSLTYPTKGVYQRVYGEGGIPGGDLEYYKLNYQHQWVTPLTRNISLLLNGELGWGGGLGGKKLPIFRNFYAGGIGSVRGYDSSTLGPKALDTANNQIISIGGDKRVVANAEVLFPMPGINDRSVRLSTFVDAGMVWGSDDDPDNNAATASRYSKFAISDMRYSIGAALTWYSPMGPIKLSLAKPMNPASDDKKQTFQFQLGSVF
ncbi:MAG: outer membrane protein assembly factor BamA [Betaproteobacteria bacterium]|nr:outer membrane protein assembly factor BamA [Betaproteobacteria bacterium]